MDVASRSPVVAACCILLGTLVAAPGAGIVDLSDNRESTKAVGTGNLTVTEVSLPGTASFERGDYGAESYYLRVPDGRIEFADRTGRPTLTYRLSIRELGYSRQSVYFVDEGTPNPLGVQLEKATFAPEELSREQYTGDLRLVLRASGTERTIANRTITVTVEE